jgi:hypothetical protein
MEALRARIRRRIEIISANRWTPFLFFAGGFLFDIFTLDRIDAPFQIGQILFYTFFLTGLIRFRLLEEYAAWKPEGRAVKAWKYQDFAVQFVLGALLSLYTLFYFKSASIFASVVFLAVIGLLLVANEFVRLKRHQTLLALTLYFVCVASMWIALVPTLLGFLGLFPFLLSLAVTAIWIVGFHRSVRDRLPVVEHLSLRKKIARTGGGVVLFLLISYYLQLIPPVPLAVQYFGIFHEIRKEEGVYILSYNRPWWKFWENGDQTFLARPGDKIVAFASVFAPRGFKDQLNIRWMMKTSRGWQKQDSIPISVSGGREQGYRGYTVKANYQPGDYRVQVETTDGREVGRIHLEVVPDETTEPRVFETVIR